MKYELKESDGLQLTIEVIDPTGKLEPHANLLMSVYNIEHKIWRFFDGANWVWTQNHPPAPLVAGPLPLWKDPIAGGYPSDVQPWPGIYVCDFNFIHNELDTGAAVWDAAGPPPSYQLRPDAGHQGYIIRIEEAAVSAGWPGAAHNYVEHIHFVPKQDNLAAIDRSEDSALRLQDFADEGYDATSNSVINVKTLELVNPGGIAETSFDDNAISERVINAAAITNEKFDDNAIDHRVVKDETIKESKFADDAISARIIDSAAIENQAFADDAIDHRVIKNGAIREGKFADNAISARVIADNAIDESAIKIDSVTYEEISDSAIREIANGIWNTSVFSTINTDHDLSGENYGLSGAGSMGHAMLVNYLSGNLSHISPSSLGPIATPVHTASIKDPGGTKFYSLRLQNMPLTDDEAKSYVGRTAVLFRGLNLVSGEVGKRYKLDVTLGNISLLPGNGWQGGELKITSDASGEVVFLETMQPAIGPSETFSLELPSGEYSFEYTGGNPANNLNNSVIISDDSSTHLQLPMGSVLDGVTGHMDLPHVPEHAQQHLLRLAGVEVDEFGRQYFSLHLADEEKSPVPGGINRGYFGSMAGPMVSDDPGDILIIKAENDPSIHEIAYEVWEEPVHDHSTPDTFGMLNRIIAGLSQYNHQITDSHYDETGRLISCRLVVFPTSEDAKNGTNALTTIEVSSSYDEKQNMKTFVASEEV